MPENEERNDELEKKKAEALKVTDEVPDFTKRVESINDNEPLKIKPFEFIGALLLFIMATIAFVNVISRYFFKFSIAFTEELEVNFFVWMTVIGIGLAFASNSHLGMKLLYKKFPPKIKIIANIFSKLLSIGLITTVNYYVIIELYNDITLFHNTSEALGIPVWLYTIGVPIFSIFVVFKLIQSMINENKRIVKIEDKAEEEKGD